MYCIIMVDGFANMLHISYFLTYNKNKLIIFICLLASKLIIKLIIINCTLIHSFV